MRKTKEILDKHLTTETIYYSLKDRGTSLFERRSEKRRIMQSSLLIQ